jgi:hypothetical protein
MHLTNLLRPRGPAISDAELKALAERNLARAAQARERMGIRLCIHPANAPTKNRRTPVLASFHHGLFS